MTSNYYKYLKYKNKYNNLKKILYGGGWSPAKLAEIQKMINDLIKPAASLTCLAFILTKYHKVFKLVSPTIDIKQVSNALMNYQQAFEASEASRKANPITETAAVLAGATDIKKIEALSKDSSKPASYIPGILGLNDKVMFFVNEYIKKKCDIKKGCEIPCPNIPNLPAEDAPDSGSGAPASGASSGSRVIVFDFDQTLITQHSGGRPLTLPKLSPGDVSQYNDLLKKIKGKFQHIFINTRGIQADIPTYFKNNGVDATLITQVYGAANDAEIAKTCDTAGWAQKKLDNLNTIASTYKISKENVYFFDDTKANIDKALTQFRNSILVTQPGIPLLTSILSKY